MKIVFLSDVEQFCAEHNFLTIGLDRLREMAVENDDEGMKRAFDEGYAVCNNAVTLAMAKAKPKPKEVKL